MIQSKKTILKHINNAIDNKKKEDVRLYKIRRIQKHHICRKAKVQKDLDYFYHSCRWVMHVIIQQQKEDGLKLTSYVPLYSKHLKKIIGNNYKAVIDHLVSAKIIMCNGKFSSSGHHSYKFKLSPKFKNEVPKFYTLKEKKLVKNIMAYRDLELDKLKERAKSIVYPISWLLKDPGLEIDLYESSDFVNTLERKMYQELSAYYMTDKAKCTFIHDKISSYKEFLERWDKRKHEFHIDDSGERLYNCLTEAPSVLRNFITYDGKTLVGLDIKNSQPFHFNVLLRDTFWRNNCKTAQLNLYNISPTLYNEVKSVIPIIREIIQVKSSNKKLAKEKILEILNRLHSEGNIKQDDIVPNIYMFPKNARTLVNKEMQTSNFPNLTKDGKLYKFILTHFPKLLPKNSGNDDLFSSRAQAKQSFIHMMYHNPEEMRSKAKQVFLIFFHLFPREAAIMMLLKNNYYKNFPRILQRIEAYIILRKIAEEVRKINADIPFFTIHDSILTTEEHVETLRETIAKVYSKNLGMVPELKETIYNDHNAMLEIREYITRKADEKKFKMISRAPHPLQKFISNEMTSLLYILR
ncbi:MAG: hypothetical protein RLY61_785 [Candidatus Parcubacteria bacterium]|jgi:hypothetical protein